jgi:hypothetical protein
MLAYASPHVTKLIDNALTSMESARASVDHLLTWVELTPEQRDRYTRAANALEIAYCRARGKFNDVKPVVDLL